MTRFRDQLAGLSPAVAALFALTIAVPHAGLYYHEHAGGEHAHVHGDDESGLAELLADYWQEHDHDHTHLGHAHGHLGAAPTHASSAELARDGGPATGHWHQQDRFHRAVVAAAAYITAVVLVGNAEQLAPTRSDPLGTLDLRVRGPPRLPLS